MGVTSFGWPAVVSHDEHEDVFVAKDRVTWFDVAGRVWSKGHA